jgi:ABC-type dipeptide/oligopeptide/nickel transport system permease component
LKIRDYIARRLLLLIPVLLGVTMITFVLSHMAGDPVAVYVTSEKLTEAQILKIVKAHHLDEPLYIQYWYYLSDLLHGDWGISRSDGNRPVIESIRSYFPATLELTIFAIAMSIIIGIPLGIVSAVRKDKASDHVARIFSLTGVSMPVFWLALLMQYVFYYQFKTMNWPYLPLSGRVDSLLLAQYPLKQITGLYILDSLLTANWPIFFDALLHIIMPSFALSYISLALISRMMRSSMLEVLRQDYITLARSKGLRERTVIYRHALRNALIPTVTVTGLAFGGLLAGAVLTESVFSWPGVGRWSTLAILRAGAGGILGFTQLTAVIYVLANLIVDVIYAALDPRIRLE